jgi:hypothetical protein
MTHQDHSKILSSGYFCFKLCLTCKNLNLSQTCFLNVINVCKFIGIANIRKKLVRANQNIPGIEQDVRRVGFKRRVSTFRQRQHRRRRRQVGQPRCKLDCRGIFILILFLNKLLHYFFALGFRDRVHNTKNAAVILLT